MNKSLKYTCLFGGGAIRGISYIGAVKAFEELNLEIDMYGGSSVGAAFAALLAIGYTSEELKEIFSGVNFNLFRDISFGIGPVFAFSKGEVFLDWIRELIEIKFYGNEYKKGTNRSVTFNDIEKDLVIITTDLANFSCKEFSRYTTPDYEIASAIRISCCMPGLMKPIEYNNTLLVDGDLQKSKPMWKLADTLKKSPNRILELRLEGYYNSNEITGIDYANAVYSCMTAISTSFINEIYGCNDKYDYLVLDTGEIVVVDFNINDEKRNELIQSGYNQTKKYFEKTLKEKKENLKPVYEAMLKHMTSIKKLINAQNITLAKLHLGEIFIELCGKQQIIDPNIYNQIDNFKNTFISNIKYPPLFGKIKLKNEVLVKTECEKLTQNLENKINELSEYINKNNIIDNV